MAIEYDKDTPDAPPATPEPETSEVPQWSVILDAPDYQKLLRPASTARAREYETKVLSVMKEILRYRLTPTGLPDAAAILEYGPDFASRAGVLADQDENVAKAIDVITAPDSPWLMFALVALPFTAQLVRNHQEQIRAVPSQLKKTRAQRKAERAARPQAEIHIPGTKRVLRFRFRIRLFSFLGASTREPNVLVHQVIGNPDIRKALHKSFGVTFGSDGNAPAN